jgi:hypothetical protein
LRSSQRHRDSRDNTDQISLNDSIESSNNLNDFEQAIADTGAEDNNTEESLDSAKTTQMSESSGNIENENEDDIADISDINEIFNDKNNKADD